MDNKNNNQSNTPSTKRVFDTEAYKCGTFLEKLNNCNSCDDIVSLVNGIVESMSHDETPPKQIGAATSIFSRTAYASDEEFKGFIIPSIKISGSAVGYSYHIYDNNYLYDFALRIRKLNLSKDTSLLPFVMRYLDLYFGSPLVNVDSNEIAKRKDDCFYEYALLNAEKFYDEHNIPVDKNTGAVDQMQLSGDFPLSALNGTHLAQCVERAALAQNIMKMCGYNSSIICGTCEAHGKNEGHCWNTIFDKNGNRSIIDYSNSVYSYKDGKFFRREPYSYVISSEQYLMQKGSIILPDYRYENGKRVGNGLKRKYEAGKVYDKSKQNAS